MSDIQNTSPVETQEKAQVKNQFIKILHNNSI